MLEKSWHSIQIKDKGRTVNVVVIATGFKHKTTAPVKQL
jgi:hypothetical protein